MVREVKKIILSAQPYEDAKSIVGWTVFIILGLLVLIGVAVYYFAIGVIAAAKWSLYYSTWLWWFPVVKANRLMNIAGQQKGYWHGAIPMISAVIVIGVAVLCIKSFRITTIFMYSIFGLWLIFLFYYLYCSIFIV